MKVITWKGTVLGTKVRKVSMVSYKMEKYTFFSWRSHLSEFHYELYNVCDKQQLMVLEYLQGASCSTEHSTYFTSFNPHANPRGYCEIHFTD